MGEQGRPAVWQLPAVDLTVFPGLRATPGAARAWADRLLAAARPPLAGDELPVVLLVASAPPETACRAGVALALARLLAASGRRVALLDGDDQRPDLTAWAEDREREGWIDVVRYGISPRRAGSPVTTDDAGEIVLLGVGSYHPVRLTADEAAALAADLREEFDHVVVAIPGSDLAAPWLGIQDAGLVLCGGSLEGPAGWRLGLEPLLIVEPAADTPGAAGMRETDVAAGGRGQGRGSGQGHSGSSAVFRRLAVLLTVLLILSAAWWFGILREERRQPGITEQEIPASPVVPGPDTLQAAAAGTTGAGVARADSAAADSVAVGMRERAAGTVPPSTARVAADTTVGRDPFLMPVGGQGYCLHISSLSDSLGALHELRKLELRGGVRGLIRRERHKGKWWYRIYVGSFPSLAAARAAVDSAKQRLGVDYAMPVNMRHLQ